MICVSVGESSWKNAAEKALRYQFTEIRLDYLEDISPESVSAVFSTGSGDKIATFRKNNSASDDERINMIKKALESGAAYADVDIENDADFIKSVSDAAKNNGALLIISYHNFDETPLKDVLDRVIEKAASLGADIVKIACRAESAEEAERLLSLPSLRNNIVIAGMGSMGERVRVLSPFVRSLFTYACPDNGKAVAPGQVPYSQLLEKQKRLINEW